MNYYNLVLIFVKGVLNNIKDWILISLGILIKEFICKYLECLIFKESYYKIIWEIDW